MLQGLFLLIAQAYLPGIYIHSLSGFTDTEGYRLYAIEDTLNRTLQTSCFKKKILSSRATENKWNHPYSTWVEFTSLRHELKLISFTESSKRIAYFNTETKYVYLNTRYLNENDCFLAGTLIHEASHMLGYRHDHWPKELAMAYVLGDTLRSCCLD